MAERPILFSGPLVRAIFDERKTETRRLITDRSSIALDIVGESVKWPSDLSRLILIDDNLLASTDDAGLNFDALVYPRVEPGDRLWVRETWRPLWVDHDGTSATIRYIANMSERTFVLDRPHVVNEKTRVKAGEKRNWPSIHMPRWAARIFLRVTDVRAERLQAIDDAAAIAEGIDGHPCGETCPCCEGSGDFANDPRPGCKNCSSTGRVLVPRREFSRIWDAIYGNKPGASWGADPWVWVIKFELDEVKR